MKIRKLALCLMVFVSLLSLACLGIAENARVITPRGPLNIRKTPDDKGKLVDSVPNKAMVTVEEVGETWSKITYKRYTGYVKTEYLRLPENLIGKEVYPDEGWVLLRAEARENASAVGILTCMEKVFVDAVTDGFVKVSCGDTQGFAPSEKFSFQYEEPQGTLDWIREEGVVQTPFALRRDQDSNAELVAELTAGDAVTVTVIDKNECFLVSDKGCGFGPIDAICLLGPGDVAAETEGMTASEASLAAEGALKKKFKAFSKEKLYCTMRVLNEKDGQPGPLYYCGFYNDQDQYRYGALVHVESGKTVFLSQYDGFPAPVKQSALLPEGEAMITLSADTLAVGDVLDISVSAWTDHEAKYILSQNGQRLIETEPGAHFTAAYRPKEAGKYLLTVTVTDEKGTSVTKEQAFTVDASLPRNTGLSMIYSQKDGWWEDKQYRHSNLGKSGCAIFTLTHILERMGIEGEEILPENLAVRYAFCLIPGEGTSNELLINSAAKAFGYSTRGRLYDDKKQIFELLDQGALFTFSIVRGHIAAVIGRSEDGSMIKVVDSAPQATFERIQNAAQYYQMKSGLFRAAVTLDDLPGARWYFETDEYGGLEYYLPTEYVVKRGVRLLLPGAGEE